MISSEKFEIFPWNENFNTGIREIDTQHIKLVKLLNNFANVLTQEHIFKIDEAFNKLAEYANFHFKSEELIWKKYIKDASLIAAHEKYHASFLPEIESIKKQKNKGPHEILEDIIIFLIKWLSSHIIKEDKKLVLIINYLKEGKNLNESKEITADILNNSMRMLIYTILSMYDSLSIRTIKLIREQKERKRAEQKLQAAYKELELLAITDSLTGLYNRRHLESCFEMELSRCKRKSDPFNIISIDIDYFKYINDTYGHSVGDEALISFSRCLRDVFKRANDLVFRIGGEEFLVLITDENSDVILNLAQKVQKNILNLKIPNEKSTVSKYMSISAGIVSIIPTKEDTFDSIIKLADERLYKAKEMGRNTLISE